MDLRKKSFRSSVRSTESKISYESEIDTKEKIKDCLRKTIAFMFSQVGVIVLIVGYTQIGAVTFMELELRGNDTIFKEAEFLQKVCTQKLWIVAKYDNTFNETEFLKHTDMVLKDYQTKLSLLIKQGYDTRTLKELWSFPASLMFSFGIIAMIGYGNMVPRTDWGKTLTVLYAIFGIPLYVVYFLNIGKGLAGIFKWIYIWFVKCSTPPQRNKTKKIIVVPSGACLWVISFYILFGTVMFATWEKWPYLDASYFCLTSLCKIGFGDLVPGNFATTNGSQFRLVMNYFYMFFGQGLMAMCYHLMREEVSVKVQEIREDFYQCLSDTQIRIYDCVHRKKRREMEY